MRKDYKTRNFSTSETVHSDWSSFPEDLLPIAYSAQGYLQCLRDSLNIPLTITSGYRSRGYNATLPNASPTSHHIWRVEGDRAVWAIDFTSPKVSAKDLFELVKPYVHGECYLHSTMGFVHISPQDKAEVWIQ